MPDMCIPFEKKYEVYARSATRHDSRAGYKCRCECLRSREVTRPNTTPIAIEDEKESTKIPTPFKSVSVDFSLPLNCENVLDGFSTS